MPKIVQIHLSWRRDRLTNLQIHPKTLSYKINIKKKLGNFTIMAIDVPTMQRAPRE